MIPIDAGGSPVYLAKTAAKIAVGRPPSARPGPSRHANAAGAAAHAGGRSAVLERGIDLPGIACDITCAYDVVDVLLGTGRWLQAELIEQKLVREGHGLAALSRRLSAMDVDDLLDRPETWQHLVGLALVQPDDDEFAVRGRMPGEAEDRTVTTRIARGSRAIWVTFPRVVQSHLRMGRFPNIIKAYTFRPVGVVEGCRAVTLPGGIVFDPRQRALRRGGRFSDLGLALAELGILAKEGRLEGIDKRAQTRLAGCAKIARNGVAYGAPVEFNPSKRAHSAWGPNGRLPKDVHEEPGWLTDPVVGALATSGCELLLTLFELLIDKAGGTTVWEDTDAAFTALTVDGRDLSIEGRGADGGPIPATIGTIEPKTLIGILSRFGLIATATRLSIPAFDVSYEDDGFTIEPTDGRGDVYSIFKITPECLIDGKRWAQGVTCRATARKRYLITHRDEDGTVETTKASAHLLGMLANVRTRGELDWDAVDDAWRMGLAIEVGREPGPTPRLDPCEPTLQELILAHPRDWRALRTLRFSSLNPEGVRPFETLLVPVPLGPSRGRLVAEFAPNKEGWAHLIFRDPDGVPYRIVTAEVVAQPSQSVRAKTQVVHSMRTWLTDYMTGPEPMALGPDGEPCSRLTAGPLKPRPVRIVSLRVGGQEPHRRQQEESIVGWDVTVEQQEIGRLCRAPGCRTALGGRERQWCARHKRYPGTRRSAWAKS